MTKISSVCLSLLALASARAAETPAPPEQIEFFEKKIRPVLVDRCYGCHSAQAEKIKGDLLVDSRDGLLKGGKSGLPSIVPGDTEKSPLIKAIRYTDDEMLMPPKGRLKPDQVADFEKWVKIGAPDPRTQSTIAKAAKTEPHWAFEAPKDKPLPDVKSDWCKTPIDNFVLAKLQSKKLQPSPIADKRTLLRRATFDLTGLPPTPEEVDAFVADTSPDAYAKLIDRLLASPQYGERWGRYWLDIARYADTKGYVFEEERRYPYSYTYRDWVIKALNEDLPYDQFLIQQIAADRVVKGDDKQSLAAMGFLTLGRRFLNQQPDIIDDRIDVVMRGTMALTVGCARCHDHKFDPIPTKDYYSLYGIFASSVEPKEPPLMPMKDKEKSPDNLAYEKELKVRDDVVEAHIKKRYGETLTQLRKAEKIEPYLLVSQEAGKVADKDMHEVAKKHDLNEMLLRRWRDYMKSPKDNTAPLFAGWKACAEIPEKEFAAKSPAVIADMAKNKAAPAAVIKTLTEKAPASLKDVAAAYASALASAAGDKPWPESERESLRLVLYGNEAPLNVPIARAEEIFNGDDHKQIRDLRKKVDELKATHPGAPPRAMVLEDSPTPFNAHVFKRGNPGMPGDEVPRQFVSVVAGKNRQPFKNGSGRLELAQAIASKDNPLTARVIVNRIWLHHFGAALVKTPSDFGTRADPPTNPDLLDFLALRFVADGWSFKKMHRLMMLSNTYQQISDSTPESIKIDPENNCYSHMNRSRLDFEALRDSVLFASGHLDKSLGGRPIELTAQPFTQRRTIYGFVDRQNLPNLFRSFDFASPDSHSSQRFSTTVPQQALFMMNSPFVKEKTEQLTASLQTVAANETDAVAQGTARIQRLYRVLYQRAASNDEVALGLNYIKDAEAEPPVQAVPVEAPAWSYGYGEFDEKSGHVKTFKPLPHSTGTVFQGGKDLPDSELGWALLSAGGGHPGNDAAHNVIRRWTAPFDCKVNIDGKVTHTQKEGDGIVARIVSSSAGKLGSWPLLNSSAAAKAADVNVKKGDTIDFMVDPKTSPAFDAFTWAPVIKIQGALPAGTRTQWNAADDFASKPQKPPKQMSAWERYTQVLLEANEFVFVD